MAATSADVLEIDHLVDLREACRIVGPDVALWGNLDPVGLLAQSRPERVERIARQTLEVMEECGHRRFVLSSGCTLALETPEANLRAMLEAARSEGAG
jgi:uroporphyrinogen-III decarboxylase